MGDRDVEVRGRGQIAHVINPDAEQSGPERAGGLRRRGRGAGRDVGRGRAVDARRLADAKAHLHRRGHAGAADAVQGHVDRAVHGDVERVESEPADRQRSGEGLADRWSGRSRAGCCRTAGGGGRSRRAVTARRAEHHQAKNCGPQNRGSDRPHAFHSTISKSVTRFS